MNEQQKMMEAVYANGFALDEARLFLNTHPADRQALDFYRRKAAIYQQALHAYEEKYGPIQPENGVWNGRWAWAEGPWPWEGGRS